MRANIQERAHTAHSSCNVSDENKYTFLVQRKSNVLSSHFVAMAIGNTQRDSVHRSSLLHPHGCNLKMRENETVEMRYKE